MDRLLGDMAKLYSEPIHISENSSENNISGPIKCLADSAIIDSTLSILTNFSMNRFCSISSINWCKYWFLQLTTVVQETSENCEEKKEKAIHCRGKDTRCESAFVAGYFFWIHKTSEQVQTKWVDFCLVVFLLLKEESGSIFLQSSATCRYTAVQKAYIANAKKA